MRKQTRRTQIATVAALVAALGMGGLAGCAQGGGSASEAGSAAETASAEASTSAEATSASGSAATAAASSSDEAQQTGVANPWSGAASAAEAGSGAGVGSFEVVDSLDLADKSFTETVFFYMDGVAQATYLYAEDPSYDVYVRKSNVLSGKEGFAGDYNEYALTWSQDVEGIEVSCYGNTQDEAQLILWQVDGNSYCAGAYGPDNDIPTMSPETVTTLVTGIK